MGLFESIILSQIFYLVYAQWNQFTNELPDNQHSSEALELWTTSIHILNTSSYVYELVKYCDECNECDTEPKYITVNNNYISNVEYANINSECLLEAPIDNYSYKTIEQWFRYIEQYKYDTIYDDIYGFPKTIIDNDSGNTFQILCISFIKKRITLNLDTNYCAEYMTNNENNTFDGLNISTTINGCKSEVIVKNDCTEWLYVYITTALCLILSTLSILCFWLYYRQGINPATKGYKRSQSGDFVLDNDEYDSDELINGNVKKKKKKKKSKLLGIDENKILPKIKSKIKRKNKYGSIAQTDEDEKSDNPFDMDPESERGDEWHFVDNDKKNNDKNLQAKNPFAGSQSDETDDEED